MALIFITTCNRFVFFPLQVKNESINKEINGESEEPPRATRRPRSSALKFQHLIKERKRRTTQMSGKVNWVFRKMKKQ